MKIWELDADANNYDNFDIADDEFEEFMEYGFDGKSIKDRWRPFRIENMDNVKKGDIPSLFGSIPVFSERAVKVLREYLEDNAEILPLQHDGEKYFLINVTNVQDCIDFENSEIKRFPSSGKIMRFVKYSFKEDVVKNQHIFKIKQYPRSIVLVSDEFRNKVLNSELEGFDFIELWDSEKSK